MSFMVKSKGRGCPKEKTAELFPPFTLGGVDRNTNGSHTPDKPSLLNLKIP